MKNLSTDPRLDFEAVLATMAQHEAMRGWITYLAGDERQEIQGWFPNPRNAAAWVTSQDPARLDTPFEYRLRPRGASEEI